MSRKGARYSQIPTLWHLDIGYPCRVMRRRHLRDKAGRWRYRWQNCEHSVLTRASARRWYRLQQQDKVQIRRDVSLEMFMQAGIVPIPKRVDWAMAELKPTQAPTPQAQEAQA